MKKTVLLTGFAISIAALASCQKDVMEADCGRDEAKLITKTMYAESSLWTPDSKSVYDPELGGIKLTGDESMDVYYGLHGRDDISPYMRQVTGPVQKVMSEDGGVYYSFSHEAVEGATETDTYDYSVISPNLPGYRQTKTNGAGTSILVEFSPVQMPGQNTHDPDYDILYGKGQSGVDIKENITIDGFKRISTPFILELHDNDGLIGADEKIRAVTVSFDAAPTSKAALAGLMYMFAGVDDYEACSVTSINPSGNALTAHYPDGLAKSSEGYYPVWFMANPVSFGSGTGLTLTIVTDSKTITKKSALPVAVDVLPDTFNSLQNLDFSRNSISSISVYQDFTALSGSLDGQKWLQAAGHSDSYAWNFSGCETGANGILPSGLRIGSGSSVTLPDIPGYRITAIRLYANPDNANAGNQVSLNGTAYDFNNYVANGLVATGGVLEIPVDDTVTGDLVLTSTGNTVLSGIALEIEQDGEVPAIDETDYYSLYTNGRSIEINGVEYNIADGREAVLVNLADLEIDHLNTDGMIFIDNTGFEGVKDLGTSRRLTAGCDNVIIGRYTASQPQITFSQQISVERDVVMKNLSIAVTHSQPVFANDRAATPVSLILEDCTLSASSSQAIILDNHTTTTFENIYVGNCVIEFASGSRTNSNVYSFRFADTKTDMAVKSVKVVNNVIYAPATFDVGVVNMGYKGSDENTHTETKDAEIEVTHNTLYNLTAKNVVVRAYQAKSLVVNDNVAYNESEGSKSYLTAIYDTEFTYDRVEVNGNYLYTPFVSGSNSWSLKHTGSYTADTELNFLHSQALDCILPDQVNLETGYIPVNTNVVTNGAGADLSTKLWLNQ